MTSPSLTTPTSPCRASTLLSTTLVEPVLVRVAAILEPTLPDFPMPTITIFPRRDSAVTTTSTLATSDSLVLTGMPEQSPAFPALGARFVPKNVGYALVISSLAAIEVFNEVFILFGPGGGLLNSGVTIVFYLWQQAFRLQHAGYASAVAIALLIITLGFSILNMRRIENEEAG